MACRHTSDTCRAPFWRRSRAPSYRWWVAVGGIIMSLERGWTESCVWLEGMTAASSPQTLGRGRWGPTPTRTPPPLRPLDSPGFPNRLLPALGGAPATAAGCACRRAAAPPPASWSRSSTSSSSAIVNWTACSAKDATTLTTGRWCRASRTWPSAVTLARWVAGPSGSVGHSRRRLGGLQLF